MGLLMISVPFASAPGPSWDWQATYEYNASGDVTSRTLNLEGSQWISCTGLSLILDETALTAETRTLEIDRMDTANLYIERERYQSGQRTTERWSCTGTQIPLEDPPADGQYNCVIFLTGTCSFECGTNGVLWADVYLGVLATVKASCPSVSGGTVSCPVLFGNCYAEVSRFGLPTGFGTCIMQTGLALNGKCGWDSQ